MELTRVAFKNTVSEKISKSSRAVPEALASGTLASYSELKRRVREALGRGRKRAEDAVEREKVRTSWEVGKLVDGHILLHQERAKYGKQVIQRLSAEVAISERELYYMVEFARAYPILRLAAKLSWGHHEALLGINDVEKRKNLAGEAVRKKWARPTLRREIKKLRVQNPDALTVFPSEELLTPIKGSLDTYRIVTSEAGPWRERPVIDLGFSNYYRPSGFLPFREQAVLINNSYKANSYILLP